MIRAKYRTIAIKTADFYYDNSLKACELYKNQAFLTHSIIDFSPIKQNGRFHGRFWVQLLHADDIALLARGGRGGGGGGVAERDAADAAERLRQTPLAKQRFAFLAVEDLALAVDPDGPEAERRGGEHHVFQHAAAVFHERVRRAVRQNEDDDGRAVVRIDVLAHDRRVELFDLPAVCFGHDRDDRRGLAAAAGRRVRSRLQNGVEQFFRNGVGLEGSNAPPRFDERQNFVGHFHFLRFREFELHRAFLMPGEK